MSLATRSLAALAFLASLVLAPPRASALGNDALIFVGPSALTVSYGDLEQQLRDAGAPAVDVTGSWPGGDLSARYRLVVVTVYDGPIDTAVADDLAAFASAGGGVVVMSEHDFGAEAGNAIATRLGTSLRFDMMSTGGGCSGTDVAAPAHALAAGVGGLDYAWSDTVSGGTLLFGSTAPIVATEGTLVLAGDSDIFSDPVSLGGCPHGPDNQRFYRNLYTSLPDTTHGMMMGGGDAGAGTGDGGGSTTAPGLGDRCTAASDCASGICLDDESVRYCTVTCTDTCANGFSCSDVGGSRVCLAPRANGGGCSVWGARSATAAWALALIGLVLIARRRRQPA